MKRVITVVIIALALGATGNWAYAADLGGRVWYWDPPDNPTVGPGKEVRVYVTPSSYYPRYTDNNGRFSWTFSPPQYVEKVYCRFEDEYKTWTGVVYIQDTLTGDYWEDIYVYPQDKTK
jgi:hypothetical protein